MGAKEIALLRFALPILALAVALAASAQSDVEDFVTASRSEAPRPGTSLRKTGDNILLRVSVVNDAREEEAPKREIYERALRLTPLASSSPPPRASA